MNFFKIDGILYSIDFLPCNCICRVIKYTSGKQFTREFKYNKNTTLKNLVDTIKRTQFFI